jgi:hypothetical protein
VAGGTYTNALTISCLARMKVKRRRVEMRIVLNRKDAARHFWAVRLQPLTSLSPALEWDGQNYTRDLGELLFGEILERSRRRTPNARPNG